MDNAYFIQHDSKSLKKVPSMAETVDCVVIGAGVVGLAVARALALQGREVLVLEAAYAIGTETSSRNSEVIHAGMYYAPGSLKARLCVQGKNLLYDYCAQRGIAHRRCGKLIVATTAQQWQTLRGIEQRALANKARALEPALACEAALLSPETGIVDSHALMLSLQGDLEQAGGIVALYAPLERAHIVPGQDRMVLITKDGTCLHAARVVNAAGLHAPNLARRFAGLSPAHVPHARYAKGSYFTLTAKAPFAHLIYPVPEADGLGVHLTLDLGGQARFGPDVQWVDRPDDLHVEPQRAKDFYAQVRKYWPGLADGALAAGYAGIRPKISSGSGCADDFLIQGPRQHGVPGLVNLFGIESPGLTSALAIGGHVAAMLDEV